VRDLVDHFASVFESTWKQLGVAPSRSVRTTDPPHVRNVRDPAAVFDAGWIEKRGTRARYCVGCGAFSPSAIVDGSAATTSASPSCAAKQLLLPDEPRVRLVARTLRTQSGIPAPGALPQRSARHAARRIGPRRSLDLAAEVAPRMGHRAALRRRPRLLRLVRRADHVSHGRRLSRRSRLRRALGEREAPDRQGHPETTRSSGRSC
jgi:hypothetical protein